MQDRFPKYFHYFSTREFVYHGKRMRNHNHLLGRIDGVDGIKTGYIHESGFNIVTDVHRGGRHIVVVVFGGRSAAARDATCHGLIANNINVAAIKRTAPPVVDDRARAREIPRRPSLAGKVVTAQVAWRRRCHRPAAAGLHRSDQAQSGEDRRWCSSRRIMHTASLTPLPSASRELGPAPATANPADDHDRGDRQAAEAAEPTTSEARARPLPPKKIAAARASAPAAAATQELAAKPHGGWMIQVGAFDVEKDAKERLTLAQDKAKAQLGEATPSPNRSPGAPRRFTARALPDSKRLRRKSPANISSAATFRA